VPRVVLEQAIQQRAEAQVEEQRAAVAPAPRRDLRDLERGRRARDAVRGEVDRPAAGVAQHEALRCAELVQARQRRAVHGRGLRLGDDPQPLAPPHLARARGSDEPRGQRGLAHELAPARVPRRGHGEPHRRGVEVRDGADVARDLLARVGPQAAEEVRDHICRGLARREPREARVELRVVAQRLRLEEQLPRKSVVGEEDTVGGEAP
jgi:hypothetical protein